MNPPAPAGPIPLTGGSLAITAIVLALGTFIQVLDTTIANVSLPTIAGNLGASVDQGTWVFTSFAVANGISVPLTGWLMGRYGVVRTFVAATFLFTLASFLCGVAWSLPVLIGFRIVQGAVSGPMTPGSQALLISIFPSNRRAMALGIWSITTFVAPTVGPILGGYISDNLPWGWIFLINVPVGIGVAFLSWKTLAKRETPTRRLPIDGIGLALLIVWVGTMQLVLDTGKDADWFQSPQIALLAAVALIAFLGWIIWELTDRNPVVDLTLFFRRNFAFGTAAFCLGFAVFFANVLLLPLWLQSNLGYTATWAGLVTAPMGLAAVLLTPIMAQFAARVDARWMATLAFGAFAASYFMRTGFITDGGYWDFARPLVVQGFAMSAFFVAMLTISLDGVPLDRIPSASGLLNFFRLTAGAFAAAITTTLWDRREALHQSRLADHTSLYDPALRGALAGLHGLGLSDSQAFTTLGRTLASQAYLLAANDLFWISGWLSVAAIALVWMSRRALNRGGSSAAADG